MGTDHVEIYKMHRPDATTPINETLHAMATEVAAGRVEVIGCSNYSAVELYEAIDVSSAAGYPRFAVTQPPYNIVNHRDDAELFPLCQAEDIAITPHSPLGNGFLTGKYSPDRSALPAGARLTIAPGHIDLYFHDQGWWVLSLLREKSGELGVPMVRLAMAWAMTHPAVSSVLVGAREPGHIDNAVKAYAMEIDGDLYAEMSGW